MSSPSARALSAGPQMSASSAPPMMNGASCTAISDVRPASEPTAQKRNWSSVATSSSKIALDSDPSRVAIAAPARHSLIGVAPSRPSDPIPYTAIAAAAAPPNANHT